MEGSNEIIRSRIIQVLQRSGTAMFIGEWYIVSFGLCQVEILGGAQFKGR